MVFFSNDPVNASNISDTGSLSTQVTTCILVKKRDTL
jgi:hypothetical protein